MWLAGGEIADPAHRMSRTALGLDEALRRMEAYERAGELVEFEAFSRLLNSLVGRLSGQKTAWAERQRKFVSDTFGYDDAPACARY